MSWVNNIEKNLENRKIQNFPDFPVQSWTTVSHVATNYGIRQTFLKDIESISSLRIGDVFKFEKKGDGSWLLKQVRWNKVFSYPLAMEVIYQDVEKWPESFPYISFKRLAHFHEYEIVWKNGERLSNNPLIVDTVNLDILKKEIDKVSWVFITECSTRSAISDLSCEIIPKNWSKNIIEVNSKDWLDFFWKTISLKAIQNLIKWSPESNRIATAIASSIHPSPKQIASK